MALNINIPKVMGNITIETVDGVNAKSISSVPSMDMYTKASGSYGSKVSIEIPRVTADVEIIVKAIKLYTVTYKLNKATSTNKATTAREGDAYNTIINPEDGFELGAVSVYVSGNDVTSSVVVDGNVIVPVIMMGDVHIKVTVQEVVKYFNIKYELTDCSSSNKATSVKENDPYSTTMTPKDGYRLGAIHVFMGGREIITLMQFENDKSESFKIDKVTADVVIRANGLEIEPLPVTEFTVTFILPEGALAYIEAPTHDINGRRIDQDSGVRFKNGDVVKLRTNILSGSCYGSAFISRVVTEIAGFSFVCQEGMWSFGSLRMDPYGYIPINGNVIVRAT